MTVRAFDIDLRLVAKRLQTGDAILHCRVGQIGHA
jgi:hypothetical protein